MFLLSSSTWLGTVGICAIQLKANDLELDIPTDEAEAFFTELTTERHIEVGCYPAFRLRCICRAYCQKRGGRWG